MADTCNSRSLSRLVRSCMPDANDRHMVHIIKPIPRTRLLPSPPTTTTSSSLSCLPDDLLIECLSRLPLSSLPSISLVCRRFSNLLDGPAFLHHRQTSGLLCRFLLAVTVSDTGLLSSASQPIASDFDQRQLQSSEWKILPYPIPLPSEILDCSPGWCSFSQARLAVVNRHIYILGRGVIVRYDTWTEGIVSCSPTLFPRKKFAVGVVNGKIYVAGGTARTTAVEEYDPFSDNWRVITDAPRNRYGCLGAAANGVLFVIGGLKIGTTPSQARAESAHVCASTMDAYDVKTGTWLRTRAVPGGGCAVGACSVGGYLYVLASHAVEVSFWRWQTTERERTRRAGGGEWARLRSPPVPGQLQVRGALRFSCVGVGESKLAVLMHISEVGDGTRRTTRIHESNVSWTKEGILLWYDVRSDEWSRGVDLPPAFRKAPCVCLEC